MLRTTRHAAFTIVELIVVISVIAILATVMTLSYGAWQNQTAGNAVKSDLANAASLMESTRTFSGAYPVAPTTLASIGFAASNNVTLTLYGTDSKIFCINGTSSVSSTVQFYIDSSIRATGPVAGTCAGRTLVNAPTAPTLVSVTPLTNVTTSLSDIRVKWTNPSPNYATQYRSQCAADASFVENIVQRVVQGVLSTENVFLDQPLGTTYFCRVRAENARDVSPWSNVITANS